MQSDRVPPPTPPRDSLKRYAWVGIGVGIVAVFVVRNCLGLPDVITPVELAFPAGGWVVTFGLQDLLLGAGLGLGLGIYFGREARDRERENQLLGRPADHSQSVWRLYRLVGMSLFALAFFGGILAIRVGFRDTRSGWESRRWPTTTGAVLESSVTFTRSTETTSAHSSTPDQLQSRTVETWFPVVQYRYEVDGQVRIGTRLKIVDSGSNRDDALARAAQYPLGAKVTVFYDPHAPSQAVLEPGVGLGSAAPLLIGAIWCLCCAGAAKVFLFSRFARQLVESFASPPGMRIYDRDGTLISEQLYDTLEDDAGEADRQGSP